MWFGVTLCGCVHPCYPLRSMILVLLGGALVGVVLGLSLLLLLVSLRALKCRLNLIEGLMKAWIELKGTHRGLGVPLKPSAIANVLRAMARPLN